MTHNTGAESGRGRQIPVDLTQPLVLKIHSLSGDVSIRAVDRPDVLIGSDAGLSGDVADEETALTIDAADNQIEVRPNPPVGAGWAGFAGEIDLETVFGQIGKALRFGGPPFAARPGKVRLGSGVHGSPDIAIEVPRSLTGRVEVHSASGDVLVEGFTGEIALNAMSGALRAVRTAGRLTVQSASGDLIVEDATGHLTAHAASGDVRVASAQVDEFQIQTANGDILVEAMLAGDGPFHARTASGDVHLTVRRPAAASEEPAATLAFHTVSGDAHVAPPFRQIGHRRWQSGPDHGGPHIDVTTVNGDLTAAIAATESAFVSAPSPADFADDVPAAPPAPAAAPDWLRSERDVAASDAGQETAPSTAPSKAARLAVLEAVERGEIDVEEALSRLDAEDAIANP